MNGGGYLELNGSPGHVSGLGQGIISDAKLLAAGVEKFRASVVDPNCFGDDTLGVAMKQNYPSSSDIDDNCAMQDSCVVNGEALGQGLRQAIGMMEEVVLQGEKNVKNTEMAT